MTKFLTILGLIATCVLCDEEAETVEEEEVETVVIFNPPKEAPGAVFFDTFQNGLGKWASTSHPDFQGRFIIERGNENTHEEMSEELELIVPDKALKYGLVATDSIDLETSDGFVFQYEVRLHDGMTCGGAYMKLLADKTPAEEFSDKTRYSVMFGPDKCGTDTNKVHFITQVFNPVSEKWVEHHLKDAPKVETDKSTHLYTLVVKKGQQEYEIFIDNKSKKKGKFADDFEPPFQPAKEIEDPDDEKPEDWVDDEKMDDPEAVKPDDWDEDAPRQILDPDASKPECWHDDEPDEVADPDAEIPDGWDEEDDGEFEAPLVPNPLCTDECGCGEWEHPMINNPDYKGIWKAPKIVNPDYIGPWKPRNIANPAYYVHKPEDRRISDIKGLAIDIWTMNQDVGFDNVFLGKDKDDAFAFSQVSWKPKNLHEEAEKKSKKNKGSDGEESALAKLFSKPRDFFNKYTPHCVFTTIILVITLSWWCCGRQDQAQVTIPDPSDDRIVPDEKADETAQAEAPAGDESKTGNEDQTLDETKATEDKGEVGECSSPAKAANPAGSEGSVSRKRRKPKKKET